MRAHTRTTCSYFQKGGGDTSTTQKPPQSQAYRPPDAEAHPAAKYHTLRRLIPHLSPPQPTKRRPGGYWLVTKPPHSHAAPITRPPSAPPAKSHSQGVAPPSAVGS